MVIRILSYGGLLFSLFLSCLGVAFAQPSLGKLPSSRLLSAEEGEAIVQAAWELRHSLHPKPDCSHFTYAAYTLAGFDYEYAQSRAIFAGIVSFQRVRKPQSGDLVVWQGHVGIVVDPAGHTFYSSVLAGFAIEDYRSNYWTNRGRPRFYRYLVKDPQVARSLASFVDIGRYAPDTSHTDVRDALLVPRPEQLSDELSAAILGAMGADEELLQGPVLASHPSIVAADKVTAAALETKDVSGRAEIDVEKIVDILYGRVHPIWAKDAWRAGLQHQGEYWIAF